MNYDTAKYDFVLQVCQVTPNSTSYSCGSVSSIEWWLNYTAPYLYTIEYNQGESGR